MGKLLFKRLAFSICIESFKSGIIFKIVFIWISWIPINSIRGPVVKVHYICKYLSLPPQMLKLRSEQELHCPMLQPVFSIFFIYPRKDICIKTHLCKDPSHWHRVAEGVDLPSNSRSYSEFLQKEFMTSEHVVNLVFIMGAQLIILAPTSSHELKSSFFYKLSDSSFHFSCLFAPPDVEELHFVVDKSSIWILS